MKLAALTLFLVLSLFFVSAYQQEQDPTSKVALEDEDNMENNPVDLYEEDADAADQTNRDLGWYGYNRRYSYGSHGGYRYGQRYVYHDRPAVYHHYRPRVVRRYYNYYGGSKGKGMMGMGSW